MDQCPVFDLWVSSSEVDPSKPYSLSHLAAPVFNPLRGALKLSPSTKDVLSALFRMPVLRKGFSKWECFWPKSNIVITSHTTKRDRLFCQLFYFFFYFFFWGGRNSESVSFEFLLYFQLSESIFHTHSSPWFCWVHQLSSNIWTELKLFNLFSLKHKSLARLDFVIPDSIWLMVQSCNV